MSRTHSTMSDGSGFWVVAIAFPPASRSAFAAAGVGAAASFALFALFTSLAPTFLSETFHVTDHLVHGATVFAVFAAAATAQLVLIRVAQRTQLVVAVMCLIIGLTLISAGAMIPTLALFIVGGIVAGAGAGIMFRSAIAGAGALAAPGRRGETLALLFLIAYAGLVGPVLVVGWSLTFADETAVLVVFAAVVLVATLGAGIAMLRQAPETRARRAASER